MGVVGEGEKEAEGPLDPAAAEEAVPNVMDSVEVVGGGKGEAEGNLDPAAAEEVVPNLVAGPLS